MEILPEPTKKEIALWPPPYTVRFSKKAKHVHLKIWMDNRGLEIIVPYKHKKWLILKIY